MILEIILDQEKLIRISFLEALPPGKKQAPRNDPVARQFRDYLSGTGKSIDVPFILDGTAFQKAVWKAASGVEYGKTSTYAEIAGLIGNPGSSRAVGNALRRNPLPLVIPCHRIVGARGKLTGFAGGITIKQFLLDLEKRPTNHD
jgi:methylated-DNA-[protein]-cysteine S-methyltransferase